jgi:hypothetical protein
VEDGETRRGTEAPAAVAPAWGCLARAKITMEKKKLRGAESQESCRVLSFSRPFLLVPGIGTDDSKLCLGFWKEHPGLWESATPVVRNMKHSVNRACMGFGHTVFNQLWMRPFESGSSPSPPAHYFSCFFF